MSTPPTYYPVTSNLSCQVLCLQHGLPKGQCTLKALWLAQQDPEYLTSGRVSDKSDVYSFGVILLELITSHKPIDFSRSTAERILLNWAELLYNDRNLDELVDPWLGSTNNGHQMQAMISAAALCVQKSSHCQPKICEVLKMLPKFSNREEDLSVLQT